MSRLLIVEGPNTGREFALDETRSVIGRQPGVDVHLDMKDVSRVHAHILHSGEQYFLEDLNSSNGTYLNGMPVKGKVDLQDQDQIAIGSNVLLLELTHHATTREVTVHAEVAAQSTNRKIYEHDPATKLQYVLEIARALGQSLDMDELLPRLLERLLALFPPADRAMVLLREGGNVMVRCQQARSQYNAADIRFSHSVVWRVLEECIGIVATEQQGLSSATIQSLGIRSFMCVPLRRQDDQAVGALQLDCFQAGQTFTESDLNVLTAISLQASIVLENAALHTDLVEQERRKRDLDLARLSKMVAGVAHEVNNPLSIASNNTVILKRDLGAVLDLLQLYQKADDKLSAQQPELYGEIKTAADEMDIAYTLENFDRLIQRTQDGLKRIKSIVESLRDFARLDRSEFDNADLNAEIRSTLSAMQGLFEQQQVTLQLELEDIPPVECSPSKINQVVFNLVHNAIDACAPGDRVCIRTVAGEEQVEIHVTDSGKGIAPEIRDKIFDPFFTTKPLGQGVGLGLSLSHGIVQDHGGSIEVNSQSNDGSHFVVRLPYTGHGTAETKGSQKSE